MENKTLQDMLDKDYFQGVLDFATQSGNPKQVYLDASRYFEEQKDFVKSIAYAQQCKAEDRIFEILDNNSPQAYNEARSFLRSWSNNMCNETGNSLYDLDIACGHGTPLGLSNSPLVKLWWILRFYDESRLNSKKDKK